MSLILMLDTLFFLIKSFFYIIIKLSVGLFVVPLSVLLKETWSWFESLTGPKKWLLSAFYFPAAGFLFVVAPWWGDF